MQLPQLTPDQLSEFRRINERFGHLVQLPPAETWHSMNEHQIWLRVVSQVVVVGRAAPAERLKDEETQQALDFAALSSMPAARATKRIGEALARIGTRMVSKEQPEASPKVKALAKNLAFLRTYPGGPKGFIRDVAKQQTSQERWRYVEKHLAYIRNKGARDFLTTGFGLVTDRIALDVRVMGVVSRIVPGFPAKVSPADYEKIERYLIENICLPLDIEPARLDQLLFRFQRQIIAQLGSGFPLLRLKDLSAEELVSHYRALVAELKYREIFPVEG
ncbi:hypothetical protein [Burkholderia multivorans]|uniref:hypothetical protein n=1 Tax=Burkholderia multivorans TaxID=87883 RepID=UPI0020A1391A|nr:hypothetical protein [Burkholderia multivorans]MCO8588745.1 hypothetical protein [Burkholderia multivorans]MCO8631120.1 hypothetical protein [Burkholderia multivorans]MCO8649023.1 hypothetical protein [Burkholderia multivorans]